MNITLSARAAVHLSKSDELAPACGVRTVGSTFVVTTKDVTCFRCVRVIEDREAAADRVAYYAGLSDQQDMDYSQAPAKDEAPAAAPERCCEHAPMYHGAAGCDTCRCNTPRNVMPQAGEVRVGRNVDTDAGRIPATAQLVEAVSLSWIPSTRPAAVITVTEGKVAVWVYVQIEGAKARAIYVGRSLVDAGKARDAYVVKHTDHVATMAKDSYGGEIPVTPVPVYKTVYNTASGPVCDCPNAYTVHDGRQLGDDMHTQYCAVTKARLIGTPAVPEYDTDARTGLPVVKIFDVRYVIGILQTSRFESDFVEFWAADTMGPHFGTVHRASATSYGVSVASRIWDAHRRIRNV